MLDPDKTEAILDSISRLSFKEALVIHCTLAEILSQASPAHMLRITTTMLEQHLLPESQKPTGTETYTNVLIQAIYSASLPTTITLEES